MPPSPGEPPPPLAMPSDNSQTLRVMVVLIEGADRELARMAKLDELLSPILVTQLEGPDDLALAIDSFAKGISPDKLAALSAGEEETEPFWRVVMRRGLKTAVLFWPEIYPDSPHRADYTIAPISCYGQAYPHTITFTEVISPWTDLTLSFSPPLEGSLKIEAPEGGTIASLRILALDTIDDGKVNYDAVNLQRDDETLRSGRWLPLEIDPHLHSGAFFKLMGINPERKTALLYHTPLCYAYALPSSLTRELNEKFSFPPPLPDAQSLARGWLTAEDAIFFLERRTEWASEAIAIAWNKYKPDLLIAHLDLLSNVKTLPDAGADFSTQASYLIARNLKRLAEGLGERELLVILSPGPGGFLGIYGRDGGKIESPSSISVEDVASVILSLLLP